MEKAMYFVTGRYKIFGDGLQLYGDIMYSKVKQDNGLGRRSLRRQHARANGTAIEAQSIRLQSVRQQPQLSSDTGCSRNWATAGRSSTTIIYRYVVGINGDFNFKDNGFISRFGYDSGLFTSDFEQQRIDSGDARVLPPLLAEIAAGNFNPFIGQNAPTQGVAGIYNNTDPRVTFRTGVPIGLTRAYDNTAAAQRAAYVGHSFFYERDWLYDVKVNMHLFPNLWNGGIDLAVGYEHREISPTADSRSRAGSRRSARFQPGAEY